MLKNGGHYKRGVYRITFFVLLTPFYLFFTDHPTWSDWQQKCD